MLKLGIHVVALLTIEDSHYADDMEHLISDKAFSFNVRRESGSQ